MQPRMRGCPNIFFFFFFFRMATTSGPEVGVYGAERPLNGRRSHSVPLKPPSAHACSVADGGVV